VAVYTLDTSLDYILKLGIMPELCGRNDKNGVKRRFDTDGGG